MTRCWRLGLTGFSLLGSLAVTAYLAWPPSRPLRLEAEELDLGEVPCGGRISVTTWVENPGRAPRRLLGWTTTLTGLEAELEKPQAGPGQQTAITLRLQAERHPGPREGVLSLQTDGSGSSKCALAPVGWRSRCRWLPCPALAGARFGCA